MGTALFNPSTSADPRRTFINLAIWWAVRLLVAPFLVHHSGAVSTSFFPRVLGFPFHPQRENILVLHAFHPPIIPVLLLFPSLSFSFPKAMS